MTARSHGTHKHAHLRKDDVAENAWFYTLTQAQRRVKIEIEPRQETTGIVTRISIEEK
jgi:hypothetical protein